MIGLRGSGYNSAITCNSSPAPIAGGVIAERKRVVASISSTLSVKSGTPDENKDFVRRIGVSGENEYFINQKEHVVADTSNTDDDLPF